jgi:protein gp37
MPTQTKIPWTDSTFNPWLGCTHVSPGCDHCYAESMNRFYGWNGGDWGEKAPRKITAEGNWKVPLKWEREAAQGFKGKSGARHLVFGGDLCDLFDHHGPDGARQDLWSLIRNTPHLTWQLLTKRPQNFRRFLPADWGKGYENVWLGVSVDDRKHGYPRVDVLRETPARVRFLSCEPLLEDIRDIDLGGIHWVIVGGESGPKARPFDLAWARALKANCGRNGAAFFFKQLGKVPREDGHAFPITRPQPDGKRDLHGVCRVNFPADLDVQEFPQV